MHMQNEIEKLSLFYPVLGMLPSSLQRALLDSQLPGSDRRWKGLVRR